MIYYLQVTSDNLSVEIDSDIGYYEHFKTGDIIHCELGDKGLKLKLKGFERNGKFLLLISNPGFVIFWDKSNGKRITINEAIDLNHLFDITKMLERNKKLGKLGL